MVELSHGKFHVVLLTPKARLLDCRCGSLVLPACDGQLGVLRNHCALLSELGFGIMQVRQIPERADAFYILDGGFVRVSENYVTVLAYDVITFEGMAKKDVETLLSNAHSLVAGQEYMLSRQQALSRKKAQFIIHMAELISMETQTPASN